MSFVPSTPSQLDRQIAPSLRYNYLERIIERAIFNYQEFAWSYNFMIITDCDSGDTSVMT
jgi:hypothetical protein